MLRREVLLPTESRGPQLQKEFLMIRLRSLGCFSEHKKEPPHVTRGLLGLCSKREGGREGGKKRKEGRKEGVVEVYTDFCPDT